LTNSFEYQTQKLTKLLWFFNLNYKNDLMVCRQSAESLYRMGIIDADEMKEFDAGCLLREPETAHEVENPVKMKHTFPATA
jgi:hypothetical protein